MAEETAASVMAVCLRPRSVTSALIPSAMRITSCRAKKRKTLIDWLFHCSASSILPLTIRENACDSPHDGQGSPVIIS